MVICVYKEHIHRMSTNNLKSLDSLKDEENKIQNKNSLVSVFAVKVRGITKSKNFFFRNAKIFGINYRIDNY